MVNNKKLFELIGGVVIDKNKTIKEAVNAEVEERLSETRDKPDNQLGFFLLAFLDRATNDSLVKEKRNEWKGKGVENVKSAISKNNFRYDRLRFKKEIKITHKAIIKRLKDFKNTKAFIEHICNNSQELLEIRGVGSKLRDWSITNVTGNEFVVDRHIARVLLRTGLVNGNDFKQDSIWGKIRKGEDKNGLSNKQYEKLKEGFSQINFDEIFKKYSPFKSTQYLWYFGRNVCTKKKPECTGCKLRKEKQCSSYIHNISNC